MTSRCDANLAPRRLCFGVLPLVVLHVMEPRMTRIELLNSTTNIKGRAPIDEAGKASTIGKRPANRPPPKRRTAPAPLRIKPDGGDGDPSDRRLPTNLPRLIGKAEVLRITGVTFPTLWRWMKEGKFPRARALGDSKSGWLENEIADWIASRPIVLFKGEAE
jgi:prophage regulatory protein